MERYSNKVITEDKVEKIENGMGMNGKRKHEYRDVWLSDREVAKLKQGYAVVKIMGELRLSIKGGRDRKIVRQIAQLRERIKELEGKR